MKKFILTGFAGYEIRNNSTVIDLATGKAVRQTKGTVKLTASDTIEGQVEAGKSYSYTVADLVKFGNDNNLWEDVTPVAEGEAAAPVEDTRTEEEKAADAAKEAHKAELKRLGEAVKTTKQALMDSKPEDAVAALEAFKAAQTSYDEYVAAHKPVKAAKVEVVPTEDEQKILDGFDAAKSEYEDAKAIYAALLEGNKDLIKKFRKGNKGASGDTPQRAPNKITYEQAQEIRELFAGGKTKAELAEQFGLSGQSISYIVNYQQHPLRKGDTEHTPLVNDHFPIKWIDSKGTERSGAPLKEDGVKLTYQEKYIKIPAVA